MPNPDHGFPGTGAVAGGGASPVIIFSLSTLSVQCDSYPIHYLISLPYAAFLRERKVVLFSSH